MTAKLAIFTVLFFIVADGRIDAWPAAVIAVPLAAALNLRLGGGGMPRVRLSPALAFIPFFFFASVRGGIDVARRALAREPDVDPALLRYRLSLRDGGARLTFVDVLSLLPGTLSADVRGDELMVHTLDRAMGTAPVRDLERRVARMFGEVVP